MARKPKPAHQPAIGHNGVDRDKLRGLVERIEAIESERAELAADVRDIFAEAKGAGFDVTAMRAVIRLRRQDHAERQARQAVIDEYSAALGDYGTTPLGAAALARASSELAPPV